MSAKKYRFVSPGVFVSEIDNSQIPASPAGIGPVVIGRAAKGPALRPVTVNSFEEFINVFGAPSAGRDGDDVWRTGNDLSAPTYGMYAAQAYLKNSSPLTYIRLLGASTTADGGPTGTEGPAGWSSTSAWGLVVFETGGPAEAGSVGAIGTQLTGALAAIIYGDSTFEPQLSGSVYFGAGLGGVVAASPAQGTDLVLGSNAGVQYQFKLVLTNYQGSSDSTVVINFNENDSRYVRKALNTNPQLANSGLTATPLNYWLGETFDRHLKSNITASTTFGAIVKLAGGTSTLSANDFTDPLQGSESPQIISCRLGPADAAQNLFKIVALEEPGDWTNRNLKISVQDIKRSSDDSSDYGTFTVVVRHLSDSDNVVRVVEMFSNCDLNPNSANFVARKIGDQRRTWEETERRYIHQGDWPSNSAYIRVEMNSDVAAGLTNPALIPFGFRGMTKWDDEELGGVSTSGNWISGSLTRAVASVPGSPNCSTGSVFVVSGSGLITATSNEFLVLYPAPELRASASAGNLSNKADAYFGLQTSKGAGSTVFDSSTIDMLRPRGGIVGDMFSGYSNTLKTETSVEFTLDDISGSQVGAWVSGSHAGSGGTRAGQSLTAVSGAVSGVLDAGYDRFSVPLYGGFDGTEIDEMDPFNSSTRYLGSAATDQNSYVFNSIRRAIDAVADPEVVEMNLATMPGLKQAGLTTNLIRTCEERADALAIIDLEGGFSPREDGLTEARNNTASTIRAAVNGMRSRGLNSSYGCTFYPWVRARDTLNGSFLWLPPSVAALGTFSSSQRKTQVWFAPAGFNRGGLTEGSAGIPVVDVAHHLRRKDRDDLYAANINPIAKFPAEGIVIFGQKTLQTTQSALDRINVRRLMIFVKKRISQIASQILFDPNVVTTWDRFKSQVEPFLSEVKANFGLSDFKVVLDDTTTTPDLVDRNIMYAKIFLKPTRAIEYIAIDFNITRTGASFDD
jgi:hypothetical protein